MLIAAVEDFVDDLGRGARRKLVMTGLIATAAVARLKKKINK
jgi:hypothetical protein